VDSGLSVVGAMAPRHAVAGLSSRPQAVALLLAATVLSPAVSAQTANPLVFEEAPPTTLRTETDGISWTSETCRDLARLVERDLKGQPSRGATLLQYYQRECPGEPLPTRAR
jgi:hypothetical protein